jgi:predicted N-acyltransferase
MRLEVLGSAADVGADEWAALARGKTIYSTRSWYLASELHPYSRPTYLAARDDAGRLRGLLAAFATHFEGNPHYNPAFVFRDLFDGDLASTDSWFPGRVGGTRAGNLNELLVAPDAEATERREILRMLATAFAEATDPDSRARWLMYLPPEETRALAEFVPPDALVLFTCVDQWLDVRWSSFDDYLASFSSKRRYAIRREIEAFEQSGAQIEKHEFDEEICAHLAPLLGAVQRKHGVPKPDEWLTDFLRQQAHFLGDRSFVLLCRHGSETVAFALFHTAGGALFGRVVGVDYDRARNFEYFNILFYEPVALAIEHGYRSIHYGVHFYDAKLARGARPRPLWSIVQRDEGDVARLRERVDARNERLLREFAGRYEKLVAGGLDVEAWMSLAEGSNERPAPVGASLD